jgi:hypothetical protein
MVPGLFVLLRLADLRAGLVFQFQKSLGFRTGGSSGDGRFVNSMNRA